MVMRMGEGRKCFIEGGKEGERKKEGGERGVGVRILCLEVGGKEW